MQNAIHNLIKHIREQSFILSCFNWVFFLALMTKLKLIKKKVTYKFSSLLQSEEQQFLMLIDIGVGMHALHLFLLVITLVLPFNRALNLALEVSWESAWNQRHLNVLMGVWLKLSRHWFQFQVVSAHQT